MMRMKPDILIVDDDPGHRAMLKALLKDWGYRVQEADDGTSAVDAVHTQPFDLILMDVRMSSMSGIEALEEIKNYNPAIPILIMTAYSSVPTAVKALKSGAYDYLTKPLDTDELQLTLQRALDHTRLQSEVARLKSQLPRTEALDRFARYRRRHAAAQGNDRHSRPIRRNSADHGRIRYGQGTYRSGRP